MTYYCIKDENNLTYVETKDSLPDIVNPNIIILTEEEYNAAVLPLLEITFENL